MSCCKCECAYLAVIVGIIAGVILGVLYSLGLVATGIIFWAYLALGALGIFLSPIYAFLDKSGGERGCFCSNKIIILLAAIGTIISAAVGLIIAAIASTTVLAIVIGLATFFIVTLLVAIICVTRCICR